MSLARYPRFIPKFATHRNLLDDVDAGDINDIQLEVSALAFILGTNPQVYNDINLPTISTTPTVGDEGGISDDTILAGPYRYYDPGVTPVDHGTVAQRLDDIERGRSQHVFKLRASNIDIATKSTALDQRPRGIRFPKPDDASDPFFHYNGVGITLRKSGYWTIHGTVAYNLQGSNDAQNTGVYQATVDHDDEWVEGMTRIKITDSTSPVLKTTLAGFYKRGTRLMLRTSHNSNVTQKVRLATLSGSMTREDLG
jgi:hypothetical protein